MDRSNHYESAFEAYLRARRLGYVAVDEAHRAKRTPFCVAISKDEGKTWEHKKTLDDDPDGWFCYTAIEFVDERVLLAHCAGDSKIGHLTRTRMTSFDLRWLYK